MESLEALFVDFDGTLVSTEEANAKAYAQALSNLGFPIPKSSIQAACIGRHWSNFLPELLTENYNKKLGELIAAQKREIYPHFFSEITLNLPLIKLLRSTNLNVPKALITNASRESVVHILNIFNLSDLFSLIVCQEDVARPKPDPECYLLALKILSVSCENCIAIEDSQTGMLAAKNAGILALRI